MDQKFTSHHIHTKAEILEDEWGAVPAHLVLTVTKIQLMNAMLLVEMFSDSKLQFLISMCCLRRLKFTILVTRSLQCLSDYLELELLQKRLASLGLNVSVKRLLKSQALRMRQEGQLVKEFACSLECRWISATPCSSWLGSDAQWCLVPL